MAGYEVVREIFNQCSGNQMRDVFFTEEDIDDIEAYMDRYRIGKTIEEDKTVREDGSICYDLITDGLHQRVSFHHV